jgi:hypothetical protein
MATEPERPEMRTDPSVNGSGLPHIFAAGEKKKGAALPSKMTVDQFLKRSPQGESNNGLIRSLYKTRIMSFGEWDNTVKTLLKKQVK